MFCCQKYARSRHYVTSTDYLKDAGQLFYFIRVLPSFERGRARIEDRYVSATAKATIRPVLDSGRISSSSGTGPNFFGALLRLTGPRGARTANRRNSHTETGLRGFPPPLSFPA